MSGTISTYDFSVHLELGTSRYRNKNGVDDLEKALVYCDYGINRFDRTDTSLDIGGKRSLMVRMYCIVNDLSETAEMAILYSMQCEFEKCKDKINELIKEIEKV